MTEKEQLIQTVNLLNEAECRQVADFLEFLKFRARRRLGPSFDPVEAARLYAEFAEEDRELAEVGMDDYARRLAEEDSQ